MDSKYNRLSRYLFANRRFFMTGYAHVLCMSAVKPRSRSVSYLSQQRGNTGHIIQACNGQFAFSGVGGLTNNSLCEGGNHQQLVGTPWHLTVEILFIELEICQERLHTLELKSVVLGELIHCKLKSQFQISEENVVKTYKGGIFVYYTTLDQHRR